MRRWEEGVSRCLRIVFVLCKRMSCLGSNGDVVKKKQRRVVVEIYFDSEGAG